MRKILLFKNTISSVIFELSSIICGFIVPQLIMNSYGSDVNGLVNSVTQFLQVISFLELGVGAVVQSALYQSLAAHDDKKTSMILSSARKFFDRIGITLFFYVAILLFVFPTIVNDKYSFWYTAALIISMSISSFAQYFFGITDRLLLNSAQRGYIQYNAQSVTIILNTISCVILIKLGAKIQVVKLVTSLIFLIRPIVLRYYVNRNFNVNRYEKYEVEPIPQKWNGIAQHIAAIVLDSTDTIVLTVFSSLSDVSIYSVYYLVVFGVKRMMESLLNGVQALMGELWSKKEYGNLNRFFAKTEWSVHTIGVFLFGCTGVLIVPFILVYTKGVNDAQYNQQLFAVLITAAFALQGIRSPYVMLIKAAGHYKQTQNCYIIAACLNIIVSIATVKMWGLIGVAVGTLIAIGYQTVWMIIYEYNNILDNRIQCSLKQLGVDILTIIVGYGISTFFVRQVGNYVDWFFMAIEVATVFAGTVFFTNLVFYRKNVFMILRKVKLLK